MATRSRSGMKLPSGEKIAKLTFGELHFAASWWLIHEQAEIPLPYWWVEGGKWQIDSEKERAEIEAILQVFPIRLLPPELKLFLEDLEGHMESLWDLGGPVYAPRP